MKQMICFFLLINTACMVNAQTPRDSIITVVERLFEAMKKADTILLRDCFSASAVLHTIKNNKGDINVMEEKIADFIAFVGKETMGAADEQIVVETVETDGPLAMVWAPYQFFYKGKFSHCGVNAIQLVRLNSGWKIQYIIDTRRREGCR